MSKKKIIRISLYIALLTFVVLDLQHSFGQYCAATLDGDIAESVVPSPEAQKILDDPTGIQTIVNNDKHLGPNRFFSHYFVHKTFRTFPQLLQNFCDPVQSVYLTSAIAKLIMQITILLLMTTIIVGRFNLFSLQFIATAAILIPFFQTNGWELILQIGIIDISITYCFFYALPAIFLLLYYLPIFLESMHGRVMKMKWYFIILWIILIFLACFSGPLNTPIILITNAILCTHLFCKAWQTVKNQSFFKKTWTTLQTISKRNYLFFIPITLVALYSFFLGTYNNAYNDIQLSLKEMLSILPQGIWNTFTSTGYLIMVFLLFTNYLIIYLKYNDTPESKKIFGLYRFLLIFSLIFLLLLPLGGFRPYRPFFLRYDTIIPVTLLSIITIGYATLFIIKQLLPEKWSSLKIIYPTLILFFSIYFTIKDKIYVYNDVEKASLYLIANSKEDIVALDNDNAIVAWAPIYDPAESRGNAELLRIWNITDTLRLYYNSPSSK